MSILKAPPNRSKQSTSQQKTNSNLKEFAGSDSKAFVFDFNQLFNIQHFWVFSNNNASLVGGFKYFLFLLLFGEDSHFD